MFPHSCLEGRLRLQEGSPLVPLGVRPTPRPGGRTAKAPQPTWAGWFSAWGPTTPHPRERGTLAQAHLQPSELRPQRPPECGRCIPPAPSPEGHTLGARGGWAKVAGGFPGLWDPGFLFVSPSGSALSREDTAWAGLPPPASQWPSACPLGSPQPRRQLHLLSEMVQRGAMRLCRAGAGGTRGRSRVGGQLCTRRTSSSVRRWCRPSGSPLRRAGDLGHLPLGEIPRRVLLPPPTLTATGKENGCRLW